MIIGVGLDLVELERIKQSLERFGDRFTDKILTDLEKQTMPENENNRIAFVASRFAAKEAGVKALGTGFSQGVGFKDVEVITPDTRKPEIVLHNRALEISRDLGATKVFVSLSHERSVAGAVVILES
ncbi:MAG: holo-ACP synthase [Desulfovibrio sp.]|nr:MAG: holo-ACP synthase [Desulfovibrio sp.]